MKNLLILLFLFIVNVAEAQVSLAVYQDASLAFTEDDHGNKPYTADIVFNGRLYNGGNRADNWSKQIFFVLDVEYADLFGGTFWRYGIGFGYTFQNIFSKISISPSLDYGRIVRWNAGYSSFNGLIDISYMFTDKVGVSLLSTLTQRNDLKSRWGDDKLKTGFYIGAVYKI